ncbi:MAG TPA: antitoxin [Elusimicrobia bacterium]|nr:antitoxin [Elusimicrobiota bacterium]HBT61680.1 antitoxin [Elusimicrobiota bacterium]
MNRLSNEEKQITRSYARGEWKSVKNRKAEVRRYRSYVRDALQKSSRVNIRISPQDLEGMQQRALEEGIPYQTLMASVIHKYVAGRFVERRA